MNQKGNHSDVNQAKALVFEVLAAVTPTAVCLPVADRNAVCYTNTEILGHLSLCHKRLRGHFLKVIP